MIGVGDDRVAQRAEGRSDNAGSGVFGRDNHRFDISPRHRRRQLHYTARTAGKPCLAEYLARVVEVARLPRGRSWHVKDR